MIITVKMLFFLGSSMYKTRAFRGTGNGPTSGHGWPLRKPWSLYGGRTQGPLRSRDLEEALADRGHRGEHRACAFVLNFMSVMSFFGSRRFETSNISKVSICFMFFWHLLTSWSWSPGLGRAFDLQQPGVSLPEGRRARAGHGSESVGRLVAWHCGGLQPFRLVWRTWCPGRSFFSLGCVRGQKLKQRGWKKLRNHQWLGWLPDDFLLRMWSIDADELGRPIGKRRGRGLALQCDQVWTLGDLRPAVLWWRRWWFGRFGEGPEVFFFFLFAALKSITSQHFNQFFNVLSKALGHTTTRKPDSRQRI